MAFVSTMAEKNIIHMTQMRLIIIRLLIDEQAKRLSEKLKY